MGACRNCKHLARCWRHRYNEYHVHLDHGKDKRNWRYESNWRKAKELLQDILLKHAPQIYEHAEEELKSLSGEFFIQNTRLTPTVYTNVMDHGITLSLRYLCKPNRRRVAKEEIWEAILDCFEQHNDIELAYPTRRIVNTAPHINSPLHRGENLTQNSFDGD